MDDEEYETWLKIKLTEYDEEITKALIKEVASLPKKYCNVCKRLMTLNDCECNGRETECYYCHLKTHQ